MDRRAFIAVVACGLLTAPVMVVAQLPAKRWRIGLLHAASRQSIVDPGYYDAFVGGLRERGYVEGKNLVIEARYADGNYDRLPGLAAELLQLKVDLIVAVPSPAIRAAQNATKTIPIVFASTGDPVGNGFVASLAHPGGNLTGLSNTNLDISAKLFDLLMAMVPKMSRVAVLANPGSSTAPAMLKSIEAVAHKVGVQILIIESRTPEDVERGFAIMTRERADAVIVSGDSFLNMQLPRIGELAAKFKLPSIATRPSYANGGGLMSYGQDITESYRRTATYVDKIFKGAKPGDLPVEQATKFEFVINLKTAKALGLTVPQSLLVRADEVIQ